jgi:ATP-binding cassette, subfamily C, bacterial
MVASEGTDVGSTTEQTEEREERTSELPAEEAVKQRPVAVLTDVHKTYQLDSISVPVIKGVDILVRHACFTVLLGPSGSGKTTLADIVLGLIEPDQGDIRFDGAATTGAQRRAQTAYVPQEAFLFDRTIRENLQWVCPEADDDALWQALDRAAAAPFVRALPQGLDTPAGNRGERFSGGERQRLCLARALLLRPRLLILDEATSALDPEVEARLLDTLAQLRGSVTVLAIAHRLPPAFKPDRTFRLSGGALHQVG